MAVIYFIRHGETDLNAQGRFVGRNLNPSLNEHGEKQAHLVKESLKLIPHDVAYIVSSNMTRTNQMAEIINLHFDLRIILDNNLQEKDKGALEGRLISEALPIIERLADHEVHPIYGGESEIAFKSRVIPPMCKYLSSEKEAIIVVSHGYVGAKLADYFLEEKHNFKNSELKVFDPAQIDLAGKCSHIDA